MSNVASRGWPRAKQPHGFPTPTNAAVPTVQGWPRPRDSAAGTSAMDILADATFRIDAQDHQRAGAHPKIVRNLGTGGDVLNARCGSTTVADSNDPLFLRFDGTPYVYLPGVASSFLSVPDEAALRVTGDIDIRWYGAMDSWKPSTIAALVGKYFTTGNQKSYLLTLNATDGKVILYWSATGADTVSATSTVAPTVTDGTPLWLRATVAVASNYAVNFYTSVDGANWTQLGATINGVGSTSIYASTADVRVGNQTGVYPITGKVFRAQVLNGINGTTVLDVDTSVLTSGSATSFTAVTGQTVTINRSTSGRKSVAVVAPVWLFGSDDIMEVRDNPALNFTNNDSFTVVAAIRQWNTPISFGAIVSKYNNSVNRGWVLRQFSTAAYFQAQTNDNAGTASGIANSSVTVNIGSTHCAAMRVNRTSSLITIHAGGLSATGTTRLTGIGTLANQYPVVIGNFSNATTGSDLEVMAVAIFRRALSDAEIQTVATYMQGKWS